MQLYESSDNDSDFDDVLDNLNSRNGQSQK